MSRSRNFSQVSVHNSDRLIYARLAAELTSEKGVTVSVPAALRLAVQFYNDARQAGVVLDEQ